MTTVIVLWLAVCVSTVQLQTTGLDVVSESENAKTQAPVGYDHTTLANIKINVSSAESVGNYITSIPDNGNDVTSLTSKTPDVTNYGVVHSSPMKSTTQLDFQISDTEETHATTLASVTSENPNDGATEGTNEGVTDHQLAMSTRNTNEQDEHLSSPGMLGAMVDGELNNTVTTVMTSSDYITTTVSYTKTMTSMAANATSAIDDVTLSEMEGTSIPIIASQGYTETTIPESITTTESIANTPMASQGENETEFDVTNITSVEYETNTGVNSTDDIHPDVTTVFDPVDFSNVTYPYNVSDEYEDFVDLTTDPNDNITSLMYGQTIEEGMDNKTLDSSISPVQNETIEWIDGRAENITMDPYVYNVTVDTVMNTDYNDTGIVIIPIGGKTTPMTTKAAEPEPTTEEQTKKPSEKPVKGDDRYTKGTPKTVEATTVTLSTSTWSPPLYVTIILKTSQEEFCAKTDLLQKDISILMTEELMDTTVDKEQVVITTDCHMISKPKNKQKNNRPKRSEADTEVEVYLTDDKGHYSYQLTKDLMDLLADKGVGVFKDSAWEGLVVDMKFHGSKDHDSLSVESDKSWQPHVGILVAIVIGAIAAVIVIAFLILQLVIMRRRRRMKKMRHSYENRHSIDTLQGLNLDSVQLTSIRMTENRWGYTNPALIIDDKDYGSNPLNFTALTNFVREKHAAEEEFMMLPNYVARISDIPVGAEDKNRYANVIPVPETRVSLTSSDDRSPSAGYINANFIRGYLCAPRSYIATQAPMDNTTEDFWRMVYEQKAQAILMLTALDESGPSRCAEYWPNTDGGDTSRTYGEFEVTLIKRDIRREWITSTLRVQCSNTASNHSLNVYHFWLTAWPNNGLPDPRTLIGYLLACRPYMERSIGPTIVHCSPGTGRTGVVLAADIQMLSYDDSKLVDVLSCVCGLRQDRAGLVQNQEQYKLIYKALVEYATALNNVSRNPSRTSSYNSIQTAH